LAAVAPANKTARIAWNLMAKTATGMREDGQAGKT